MIAGVAGLGKLTLTREVYNYVIARIAGLGKFILPYKMYNYVIAEIVRKGTLTSLVTCTTM